MAPFDVARVRRIEERAAVGRQRRELDRAVARRERDRRRLALRNADGVPAHPFVRLRLKHDVVVGPSNRAYVREILVVFLVVPELLAFAARDIRDPERQRVATRERGRRQSRNFLPLLPFLPSPPGPSQPARPACPTRPACPPLC